MPIIKINGAQDDLSPVGISQLGTAVFDNVIFPSGKWFSLDGEEFTYNRLVLDSVSITVDREKHIVESQINGHKGSELEYVSTGNYSIKIDALITPELYSVSEIAAIAAAQNPIVQFGAAAVGFSPEKDPTETMINIRKLDDAETPVIIESKYLNNIFGINRVVIRRISYSKGSGDTHGVTFECISNAKMQLGGFV